jgi:hypothetical protein
VFRRSLLLTIRFGWRARPPVRRFVAAPQRLRRRSGMKTVSGAPFRLSGRLMAPKQAASADGEVS